MAIEVPVSSDVMMPTLAPLLMHCSAWASCFCGWLRAFTTAAVRPAFLNALMNAGLSNCCQRGDDVVSGSRTHTCVPVAVVFAPFPAAPLTMRPTAAAATRSAMLSFFTPLPSFIVRASRGDATPSVAAVQTAPVRPPYPRAIATSFLGRSPSGAERPRRRRLRAAGTDHGASSTRWSDRAAAPRTAAPSPKVDGRVGQLSALAGDARPEVRRQDEKPPRTGGQRALLQRPAHGVLEPGGKRPEAAAEHDRLHVEEVEGRRERYAERASRFVQRADDLRIGRLGPAHELVREAARPARDGRNACGACDRLLADQRLDAPSTAAAAQRAVRVDGDVTELAAEAVRPAEEPAAEHDAAAHADLAEDADEVVDPDGGARPVLRERG